VSLFKRIKTIQKEKRTAPRKENFAIDQELIISAWYKYRVNKINLQKQKRALMDRFT